MKTQDKQTRGVTLIELVVVILIVAILIALILPAVQSARESSRKIQCSNNLRQIGIAFNAYVANFSFIPPGNHQRGYSLHVALLPYLDQMPLYQAINFNERPFLSNALPSPNYTVSQVSLAVFLCPTDGNLPDRNHRRPTNYAGNMGYGYCGDQHHLACNNGAVSLTESIAIRPGEYTDGMSSTIAVSEWVFGPKRRMNRDALRTVFMLRSKWVTLERYESSLEECRLLDVNATMFAPYDRGGNWQHGTIGETLYTHAAVVNDRSCYNSNASLLSIITAASLHGSGANVLHADGHVSYIASTVSLPVWRALSTRAGGDIAP